MNRRKQRIMLIFVVLCLVFMFPMQVFASVTVDDEANFFSAEEIAAIEAAANDTYFNYYVTTLEGTNGQSPSNAALEVIERVGSEGYHYSIFIDAEASEVYLNYIPNGEAESVIGNERNAVQIIDNEFLPAASTGEYGQGVINIMDHLERERTSGTVAAFLFVGALGIALIVSLFYLRAQKKKRLAHVHSLLDRQKRILADVLKPYHEAKERVELSRGNTQQLFIDKQEELFAILTNAQEQEQELKTWLDGAGKKKKNDVLQATVDFTNSITAQEEQLETKKEQLKEMFDQELKISGLIKAIEEKVTGIRDTLEEMKRKTNLPYTYLESDIQAAEEKMAEMSAADDSLDYLYAAQLAEAAEEACATAETHVDQIKTLLAKEAELIERIDKQGREIDQIVEREQLRLKEEDPHALLEAARQSHSQLHHAIEVGNAKEAIHIYDSMDAAINDALQRVKQLLVYRDETKRELSELQESMRAIRLDPESFRIQMDKVRHTYHSSHWHSIESDYHEATNLYDRMLHTMNDVDKMLQLDSQEYKKANQTMQDLLAQYKTLTELHGQSFYLFDRLEQQKQSLYREARAMNDDIQSLEHQLHHHRLRFNSHRIEELYRSVTNAIRLLDVTPIQLFSVEDELEHVKQEFPYVQKEVQSFIQDKERLEREWRDVSSSYQHMSRKLGLNFSQSTFKRRYDESARQVDYLITEGQFASAKREIDLTRRLVDEMRDEERRMARKAAQTAAVLHTVNRNNNRGSRGGGSGGSRGGGFGGSGGSRGGGFGGSGGSGGSRGGGRSMGGRGGGSSFRGKGGGRKF
ncbi:TPM domain-containing protein [Shouchella hunanensis]|uniref:TPM domain-containing protein n=1 Tax=Shouchella hunanensis TaxID=766894 RepID=A0ABY7W9N4_9BACI|nr:TPM domain-containing protein [Shouchella hunanensis]WDF05633.1 TPM domain-containing protein [Shouchella hunanensis]